MLAFLALGVDFTLPAFSDTRAAFGFDETSEAMSLAMTAYFVGVAGPQIIYGPLADRFGRIPVLRASFALYALGALGAALAPNFALFLTARFVWGVGAAGARSLAVAIARDVHRGDRLARVMALGLGIFMLVPIFAPLAGQALLGVSDRRLVFGFPGFLGLVAIVATFLVLPETLPPSRRRPLSFAATRSAIDAIRRSPLTVGYGLVLLFDFASFGSFLSSTELLFDSVYDRAGSFAVAMAVSSAINAAFVMGSTRIIGVVDSNRLLQASLVVATATSAVMLVLALQANGAPNFWVWFGLLTAANSFRTVTTSLATAGAMEEMGDLAGTASAVIGSVSMSIGVGLAAITDRFQSGTVVPMSLSYFGYTFAGLIAAFAAFHLSRRPRLQ